MFIFFQEVISYVRLFDWSPTEDGYCMEIEVILFSWKSAANSPQIRIKTFLSSFLSSVLFFTIVIQVHRLFMRLKVCA